MAKGGGKQTVTQTLDPGSRRYLEGTLRPTVQGGLEQLQGMGAPTIPGATLDQQLGIQGIRGLQGLQNPMLQGLFGQNQALANQLGMSIGDLASQFQNPFEQQVIGGLQSDFDRQRALASTRANQAATQSGAFGGSRGAVLSALGQRDVNQQEAQTLANVRAGGYQQALQGAMGLRGEGLQGLQNLMGGLQYGQGVDLQRGQSLLQGGELMRQIGQQQAQEPYWRQQQLAQLANLGIGPLGFTQTSGGGTNPFLGALGGAGAGAAFGPVGAAIGGGLGLLGGIFG